MFSSNEFRINLLLHIFTYFPVSLSTSIQFINETICDTLATRTRYFSIPTSKGFAWYKANQQQKRWRSPCLSTIRPSSFSQAIPQPTWFIARFDLPELPPRTTRSPSLALRMSGFDDHKTKSVWERSRVLWVTVA